MRTLASQLEFIAAGLGLLSAWFFALGALMQKSQDIVDVASTYWDYNENLQKTLTLQKADYLVGAILLIATFCLQIAALVTKSSAVVPDSAWSVPMASVSSGLLAALVLRKAIFHFTTKKVESIRAKQMEGKDDT